MVRTSTLRIDETPTPEPVAPSKRPGAAFVRFADAHPWWMVFGVALLLRVGFAVVVMIFWHGRLFDDDSTYPELATAILGGRTANWDEYTRGLVHDTGAFVYPLAGLYWLLSPWRVLGEMYVAFQGAFVALFCAMLAAEVVRRRTAVLAGLVVAVLPSQVLFSSITLKDASVWLALVACGLLVARANRAEGRSLVVLLIALAAVVGSLSYLRSHTMVVAAWASALALLFGIERDRRTRTAGAVLIMLVVPLLVGRGVGGITVIGDAGSLQERRIKNAEGAATAFVDVPTTTIPGLTTTVPGEGRAPGENGQSGSTTPMPTSPVASTTTTTPGGDLNSAFSNRGSSQVDDGLTADDIRHLPRGLSVMLFEPFPWERTDNRNIRLVQAETLLWYPMLGFAVVGLLASRRRLAALAFPIAAGAAILVLYALTEGNFGTAYRHRGEFVWMVAVLAAVGVTDARDRWRRRHAAS